MPANPGYQKVVKPLLDRAAALALLPVLGLSAIVVAPLIKADDRGPVLFKSTRRGKNGKPFTILKFRTMTVDAPDIRNADGSTLTSRADPRVTRVGKLLRKTSVDELPQLINVLRGEMSMIGPRPQMAGRPYEALSADEKRTLLAKPGITGLAQVRGRNSLTSEQRQQAELEYVDNIRFMNDLKIALASVTTVLGQKNVNAR